MIGKVALLCALVAVVMSSHHHGHHGHHVHHGHHDHHKHHHHQPKPYHFGYDIKDHHGSQYRKEVGDGHGGVKGSYGFTDHRGVHREVHYIADHHGFRAEIKTNERGTASKDPAHVHIHSNADHLSHHDHHHGHHDNHHHGHHNRHHGHHDNHHHGHHNHHHG